MTPNNKPAFRSVDRRDVPSSLRRLLSLTYPYRALFLTGMVALAVGSGVNLLFPEIVRRLLRPEAFDYLVTHQGYIVLCVVALFIAQGTAFFVRSYLFGLLGQRVYADLRRELFQSLLKREISFFDTNRSSDLATRINSDAALVQEAVSVKLSVIARYGIQVVVGTLLMLAMSWKLTVALVLSVLVMVTVSMLFVRSLKRASRVYQAELAAFTSFASECFSGVKVVRALGALESLAATAQKLNDTTRKAGERRGLWSASFSSGASAILNVLLLSVAWYGLSLVGYGSLPFNELAAFALYGAIVAVSFSFLISAYAELMQGLGGLERVFELLSDSRPDNASHEVGLEPFATRKQERVSVKLNQYVGVECKNVYFAYPDRADRTILDDLSLEIQAGLTTALIGPSGCGKSTLIQLLCGLYTINSGSIVVSSDGERADLREVSEDDLRAAIAWVPQDSTLFGFSIFDNLALGNSDLTREELSKILHRWEFLDFIAPLESGIDTVLGERGTLLSGGQRQRLAIARALIRKPALLILDEATSGLDSQSEESVMRAIREYIPRATIIIISHRLATVSRADRIYVMSEGRVVECGSHQELSRSDGIYKRYAERQALQV